VLEDISDGIVHRIVEESFYVVLIVTNIGAISIEAFSHLEDTRSISVFFPEILGYFWDSINSDTIKLVGLYEVRNP
jgi:hypothetical protein